MQKLILYLLGTSMMCTLMAQVEPGAGKWKTWVIPSGDALRLPAPPDSTITATELLWVKECVTQRDQATLATIHFWDAGSPGYRWMQMAQQSAHHGLCEAAAVVGQAQGQSFGRRRGFKHQWIGDLAAPRIRPSCSPARAAASIA